jgi:hypothetical protein
MQDSDKSTSIGSDSTLILNKLPLIVAKEVIRVNEDDNYTDD